tara:strand:- start:58190 stop:58438 length:249 start_codon:yes stop_codon:yes gene_type:complete
MKTIVSILFITLGVMLLLGELQDFELLTFVAVKVIAISAIYIGLQIAPIKIPFNKREQTVVNILEGITMALLLIYFISVLMR